MKYKNTNSIRVFSPTSQPKLFQVKTLHEPFKSRVPTRLESCKLQLYLPMFTQQNSDSL